MNKKKDNGNSRLSVIVIGETIVNTTFRCSAPLEGDRHVPYASFDEEYLEQQQKPELFLQGALPIAEYLEESLSDQNASIFACTAVATKELGNNKIAERYQCADNTLGSEYVPPIVTRVVRIPQPRIGNASRRQHPHLRIDRIGNHPADFDDMLDGAISKITDSDRRVCLVRSVTPQFFGCNQTTMLQRIDQLQEKLSNQKIELILDIRPLPNNIHIRNPSTIVSSTIQRLRELTGMRDVTDHSDIEVVVNSFWKLTPARGLLCFCSFAATDGALFCLRDRSDPAQAKIYSISVPRPQEKDFPDAGAATGGDAFVAAFTTEWLKSPVTSHGATPAPECLEKSATDAMAWAGAALLSTMEEKLGENIQHAKLTTVLPRLGQVGMKVDIDPRRSKLERIIGAINNKVAITWDDTSVCAPNISLATDSDEEKKSYADPLRSQLDELSDLLKKWKPHPGRDVIAIYGESRAGKEYPLNQVLLKVFEQRGKTLVKQDIIGPINQYAFLANIKDVAETLAQRKDLPCVLQIDEIVKGDSARPLLNLLAEKKHSVPSAAKKVEVSNFENTLVVLLSSIDPEHMLTDVQGRLMGSIKIPPLRDRWMEIPFALPMSLGRGLRYWGPPKTLHVTYKLMSALLQYDYKVNGDDDTPGLGQQNFRAFEDILASVFRHARGSKNSDWKLQADEGRRNVDQDYEKWKSTKAALDEIVILRYDNLPLALRERLPTSVSDDTYFEYTLAPADDNGLPILYPAKTSDIRMCEQK